MSKNKFPKSVSFNLNNPNDVAILDYIKKRNFSGYVKKLILADMTNNNVDIKKSITQKPLSKLDQLRQNINDYSKNNSNSDS